MLAAASESSLWIRMDYKKAITRKKTMTNSLFRQHLIKKKPDRSKPQNGQSAASRNLHVKSRKFRSILHSRTELKLEIPENIFFFVWILSSHSRIFHSFGDVTITGEGQQILTYVRHLWPLSSEGSLACHTNVTRGIHL